MGNVTSVLPCREELFLQEALGQCYSAVGRLFPTTQQEVHRFCPIKYATFKAYPLLDNHSSYCTHLTNMNRAFSLSLTCTQLILIDSDEHIYLWNILYIVTAFSHFFIIECHFKYREILNF